MDTFWGENHQTARCLSVIVTCCKLCLVSPVVKLALTLQYRKIALRTIWENWRKHSVSKGPGLTEHPESQKDKKLEGSQT